MPSLWQAGNSKNAIMSARKGHKIGALTGNAKYPAPLACSFKILL